MRNLKPVLFILGAVSVAALAALSAAPAAAQTPDGLPPALETVCDMETGAAFGWCNAYCEAMDCELANDNDPATEPKASATACSKVRAKFQQATGRDLPCEVSCPCTDLPESFPIWAAYLAGEVSGSECLQDAVVCFIDAYPLEYCTPPLGDVTVINVEGGEVIASSLGLPVFGLDFAFCGDTFSGLVPLTPAQGASCKQQLDAVLDASGLACYEIPPA